MKSKINPYDIRVICGLVLGIIGVFLVICGFLVDPAVLPSYVTDAVAGLNNDPINANLYSGIGLIVVAIVFGLWTWLSPEAGSGHADEKTKHAHDTMHKES